MNNPESVISIPNPGERGAELLAGRRSTPARLLAEPGPDRATLLRMLQAAVRVPDHGRRVPFRFVAIEGDARDALGVALVEAALAGNPDTPQAALDKDRQRFSHAPLVVAVVAVLDDSDL